MGGLKQCFYEGYFLSSICICKVYLKKDLKTLEVIAERDLKVINR